MSLSVQMVLGFIARHPYRASNHETVASTPHIGAYFTSLHIHSIPSRQPGAIARALTAGTTGQAAQSRGSRRMSGVAVGVIVGVGMREGVAVTVNVAVAVTGKGVGEGDRVTVAS